MTSSLLIDPREWEKLKTPIPAVGDAVSIDTFILEGEKYRVQNYCGTLIARHKRGRHTTITVRRVFQGVGIERIFPLYSVSILRIQILRRAKIRRAKLYYLRNRKGQRARLRERLEKKRRYSITPTSVRVSAVVLDLSRSQTINLGLKTYVN
jgi:large subunit ribosomal protein L19